MPAQFDVGAGGGRAPGSVPLRGHPPAAAVELAFGAKPKVVGAVVGDPFRSQPFTDGE